LIGYTILALKMASYLGRLAMHEIWHPIPFLPGYHVSNMGGIRGLRGQIRVLSKGRFGYVKITVRRKNYDVHRIVARVLLGEPPFPKAQVNHKNGVRDDNRIANLEWTTGSQNSRHSFDALGRVSPTRKLTADQVRDIRAATGKHAEIARRYFVTPECISMIRRRLTWTREP
jgi:hypothetical protein